MLNLILTHSYVASRYSGKLVAVKEPTKYSAPFRFSKNNNKQETVRSLKLVIPCRES